MPKPSLDRATLLYGVLVAASCQMGADAWAMLDAGRRASRGLGLEDARKLAGLIWPSGQKSHLALELGDELRSTRPGIRARPD